MPAEDMKGRKGATTDFRVPLSTEAQAVIAEARKFARDGFLFPGVRKGVISDMTMSKYMDRRGLEERPHGFRASLRNWLAEATSAPHDVAEMCIAHVTGSKTERAYRRTDFLEQRRVLMERWAMQITSKTGAVVDFCRCLTARLIQHTLRDLSDFLVTVPAVRPKFYREMQSEILECKRRFEDGDYLAIYDALLSTERGCLTIAPLVGFRIERMCRCKSDRWIQKGRKVVPSQFMAKRRKSLERRFILKNCISSPKIAKRI